MSITVEAVYENGVLRLRQPVSLPERALVSVTIVHDAPKSAANGNDTQGVSRWLAEIAALPVEGGGEEFSGRDHDRILYGDKGPR
jgi:predicted DNA-binding antitoxin AbrB/MazE fold protein